jgi:hypothetical protein
LSALDFFRRVVNEIIVGFLGPLLLTRHPLSRPITPMVFDHWNNAPILPAVPAAATG